MKVFLRMIHGTVNHAQLTDLLLHGHLPQELVDFGLHILYDYRLVLQSG
jgi:hypothetical protein